MDKESEYVFPYVYGSMAFSMGKKSQSYTHKWICYVRGYNSEDLSYLIQKVQFVLHSSFQNPVRTISKPPFQIQQHGWGEFQILIRLHFRHPNMPTIQVPHMLKLHHNHNTGSQAAKKPLCSEVYDEVVFTQNDEYIEKINQEKELMKNTYMDPEVQNGQQLQVATPQLPLRSINYYSRYFTQIYPEDHKNKLDDALRFITGELKSLQQKMRNADMDLNKVYDEIYDRIP